jgi:hypothetical protein
LSLFAGSDTDEDEYEDNEDNDDDDIDEFARTAWEQIAAMIAIWGAKERAATIIQAAARGRAVRAWNTFISAPVVSNNDNNGSALVTREVVSHLLWTLRLFGNRISAATVAVTAITALAKTRRHEKVITNEAMVTAARGAVVEWVAAIIIQAAARGRAVRLAALDTALLMRLRKERRRATKETRRAWKVTFDPTTWYRV